MRRLVAELGLALTLAVLAPAVAGAQAIVSPSEVRLVTLNLEESLRAALGRAPEVRGAEAEVEGLRGKQLQAVGIGRPQLEITGALGPSPRARGDQVSSPDDQYSPDITGVFLRGGIELIQPIFTWGLIENARLAAEHGLRATQAGVDVKSREVALRVKEAYWGAVAAESIRAFLFEVQSQLDLALERTRRLIVGGYSTDLDLFRLLASRGDLEKGVAQAERNIGLARRALATWTGQPANTVVQPADEVLPETVRDPAELSAMVSDAIALRPEFIQLREGLVAKRNLVEVERKRQLPLFFVGIVGSASYATNRDRLDNPYVIDPLYHLAVGPVLGFRYNLDFGITKGKIKEAEAEVQKLEALQDYAVENIPLQVAQAHGTVREAKRNVEYFREAHLNARKWLVAASSNYDVGIGEARELADAFIWYAKTRAEYLLALYNYVYGTEQLANAVGLDLAEIHQLTPVKR
jgi:outer membrane protein TolC